MSTDKLMEEIRGLQGVLGRQNWKLSEDKHPGCAPAALVEEFETAARRKGWKLPEAGSEEQEEAKKPPLGSGERFKALSAKLAKKGVKDPDALAAKIGRMKYGKKKFQKMAARGKK